MDKKKLDIPVFMKNSMIPIMGDDMKREWPDFILIKHAERRNNNE